VLKFGLIRIGPEGPKMASRKKHDVETKQDVDARARRLLRARHAQSTPERPGREFKVRLSEDIARMIEARATAEDRPQNRVIANLLASIPHLEQTGKLAEQVAEMHTLLADYASRLVLSDLADEIVKVIDEVLGSARQSARESALDRLRVLRGEMRKQQTK
jgi:hypothetical protein